MKIIHIIPNLRKGGAERLALDICVELSRRNGVAVYLIALSEQNDYTYLSSTINYKIIPSSVIPSITGKTEVQIDELTAFIKAFKPDVIHSHLFQADLVSRWKIDASVTYFSHCHDNMHQLRPFVFSDLFSKTRLTELFERWLIFKRYKKCENHFIAISSHTKNYFDSVLLSSLKTRLTLLPNAIDYDRFFVNKDVPSELTLINVGSFVQKKNQRFFVSVVESLHQKGVRCNAALLGDGPLFIDVGTLVQNNGLSDAVEMPGNVDDVESWLQRASIYVHTALYEPLGLVLLEAMATGLPVIALNGGGNVDIIDDGKNGYLIEEQDPELFAEKILAIWNNKELYQHMSLYAQEYARRFDVKAYVDRLLQLYQE